MAKLGYVYIMSNQRNGTLYIGVTSNLLTRVYQHKTGYYEGFTKRYGLHILVYYEQHPDIVAAIQREKQLKAGNRKNKLKLIESLNPQWNDLYDDIDG